MAELAKVTGSEVSIPVNVYCVQPFGVGQLQINRIIGMWPESHPTENPTFREAELLAMYPEPVSTIQDSVALTLQKFHDLPRLVGFDAHYYEQDFDDPRRRPTGDAECDSGK
jgi:hypothetical protein